MIHTLISLTQDLSHWPHSNNPWVVICLERTPLGPNDFSHILHLKHLSPVWTFWCCPRVCAFLKDSPHVLQEIDFCFVWTLMWYFNWSSSTKVLLQCWQENGLSPEWYFFCLPREPSCVNDLLHCLHEKDLFPVWTTLCIFRIWLVLKYCSQKRQTNSDFCFVWTLIWCFNCPASRKVLFQCWQEKCFSPEWCFSCLPRVPACVNDLLQYLYVNDLVPVCTTLCLSRSCLVLKSFPQMMHAIRIFDINVTSLYCNCCTLWVDVFTCTKT